MKCHETEELLSLHIDRMLEESQVKEVEEHIAACGSCKKEYDELKQMTELLGKTEMVPVPDAFQLRLKKALKEEKQSMIASGIIRKSADGSGIAGKSAGEAKVGNVVKSAKKKNKWRIITSIAAIFTVGLLSFGLYDNISGSLPGGPSGNDQSGAVKSEKAFAPNTSNSAVCSNSAVNSNQSSDGSVMLKDQSSGLQATYGAAAGTQNDTEDQKLQNHKADSKEKTVMAPEEKNAENSVSSQAPMYNLASGSAQNDSDEVQPENAPADKESSAASIESAGDQKQNSKRVPDSNECSRSLTVSGIERNAAAVQYYNNLIEEKLSGFDYQILESSYAQNGEWQFRVFIFRGKDGNTYNEEIKIIGKDGEIKTICSNEDMGL